jgi:hypothetical protein
MIRKDGEEMADIGPRPKFDIGRAHSYKPVYWEHEQAQDGNGGGEKTVDVVWWDYDAKVGKAVVSQSGDFVDVFVTDYAEGDLTIGVRDSRDHDGAAGK